MIEPGKWLSLHKGYQQALIDAKQEIDAKKRLKHAANDAAAEVLAKVIVAAMIAGALIVLGLIFK